MLYTGFGWRPCSTTTPTRTSTSPARRPACPSLRATSFTSFLRSGRHYSYRFSGTGDIIHIVSQVLATSFISFLRYWRHHSYRFSDTGAIIHIFLRSASFIAYLSFFRRWLIYLSEIFIQYETVIIVMFIYPCIMISTIWYKNCQ